MPLIASRLVHVQHYCRCLPPLGRHNCAPSRPCQYPIKQVNGHDDYLRDVASVSDGFQVQTNIVRQVAVAAADLNFQERQCIDAG